jgi:hypothetical protein
MQMNDQQYINSQQTGEAKSEKGSKCRRLYKICIEKILKDMEFQQMRIT